MVKTLSERLGAFLTGLKEGRAIPDKAAQLEAVRTHKRVRNRDYIFKFELHGAGDIVRVVNTTAAGWLFILTGAAVEFEGLEPNRFPRVSVKFPMFSPDSPFDSEPKNLETVPAGLVFGREGVPGLHFEEQKNLFYVLGETFTIAAEALNDTPVNDIRGTLVLTGLELDLRNTGV